MFPRLASTSRAKPTKFGIVAPAFVRDGVEDRFYGNEHPVYQDAGNDQVRDLRKGSSHHEYRYIQCCSVLVGMAAYCIWHLIS